jgi:hypothetical protein
VNALEKEGIATFPVVPALSRVARFEFFRKTTGAIGGCLVSATRDASLCVADHDWSKAGNVRLFTGAARLAGFCCTGRADLSALTAYVELADGRTVVATDGADVIEPATDGQSLHVRWTRWAVVGTPAGKVQDVGLTSDVVWRLKTAR